MKIAAAQTFVSSHMPANAATPAQEAVNGSAGIIGPDGKCSAMCPETDVSCFAISYDAKADLQQCP